MDQRDSTLTTSRPTSANDIHRYGDWEVRPRERALRVRGELQKIGGRAFDVLLALIDGGDQVVRKSDLLDAAWPGLVVEENNLSVQISTLRRLLGAGAIVNVAGLGYRLAAPPAAKSDRMAPGRSVASLAAAGLIGREDEIAALLPRLDKARLITLVGTGGVGKSSLARALLAASDTVRHDGVHWIDLESFSAGTDLLAGVGRSLGVITDCDGLGSEDVMRLLARIQALIVLDNCEHLLEDVARCVAPLMRAAPSIQWLATSQEPLHLQDEEIFRLLPLTVAAADATVDEATSCSALALLQRRAQAADRTFTIAAIDMPLALDLCRAFDGLPLAIEMAAVRVAALGLHAVHAQLNLPMTLRSGMRQSTPRHHTLRQAYEWSYGLLNSEEQRLFRRLQPFQGGFTTTLLERYLRGTSDSIGCPDGIDTIDGLIALVEKSLVQKMPAREPGSATRYRLLESARAFAQLQLQSHGEMDAVDACHAEAVASWFDDAEQHWQRWRDAQWAAHYVPEKENVVAAASWASGRHDIEPDLLARLLAAATQLEAFSAGEAAVFRYPVSLDRLHAASPTWRARACSGLGWAHYLDGNGELGTRLLEQALADYETLADTNGAYLALTRLIRLYSGRPAKQSGTGALWLRLERIDQSTVAARLRIYAEATVARHFDPNMAVERLIQLVRLAQHAGFEWLAVLCQVNATDHLLLQQRFSEAAELASVVLAQGPRFLRPRAAVLQSLALAMVRLGRIDEALRAARQLLRAVPKDAHMMMDLCALAKVQVAQFDDAALMAGHSARIKAERHFFSEAAEAAVISDTMAALQSRLESDQLARLLALGASMSSDDILAIAELV